MPTKEDLLKGFTIGDWEILPGRGVFRRGEKEVRPEPLTLKVLYSLAMRDGELVTRDDLIKDAWDGRAVADDPINRTIAQLRKSLDDKTKPPRYIETLHRRGYRLMKPVVLHEPPERETESSAPAPSPRLWRILAAFVAVGFIAIIIYIFITPARSIGVMPFENVSGEASDIYLVSGFQKELVRTLINIPDFTVTDTRGTPIVESCEIARSLNVESVLLGSVLVDSDVLIIRYQISRKNFLGNCKIVFADKLTGSIDKIFSLQAELATMVRDKLVGKRKPMLIKSRPSDSKAYDSYMRGIYALERRGDPGKLEAAVELLQSAISLDENYGPSYLALATAYAIMVDYRDAPWEEMNRLALQTVEQGTKFDPIIIDAAGAIYGYNYHRQKRWAESEEAYLKAVSTSIVDSNAFNWYSRMLASVGRFDAALELALRAVEIDPSSGILNNRVAITYTWLGNSDNAHEYFRRSNDLGASGNRYLVGYALLLMREGRFEEARNLTTAGVDSAGYHSDWVGPIFDAMSDPSRAGEALQTLDVAVAEDHVPPFIEFVARAVLGDLDGAMQLAGQLELPGEIFDMDLLFIPELRALRQHPDFMPLLERLGVVDYWASAGCEWVADRVTCKQD